ncbi:MAG: glycosyltransferase [Butyrivibrio sp.]|nr:glycosyltransferase [Butyrivibrio sp.]
MEAANGQIRVLHVLGVLGVGGAESRIIDLYRNMDRDKIQFDFLVHYSPAKTGKKSPTSDELMAVREPDYFDKEVLGLGGRIFCLPRFNGRNLPDYKKAAERFFKQHRGEFKVVQGHMTSMAAVYLPIAKRNGVPICIAHARSAGVDSGIKGIATRILRLPLRRDDFTDYNFACSGEAGEAVFGKKLMDKGKVRIIPNAVDVGAFAYNSSVRERYRRELGVTDEVVIGHVGSFRYAKNHEFLLRTFAQLISLVERDAGKKYPALYGRKIRLLMLGKGGLFEDMKKLSEELSISGYCIFAGNRSDVDGFYQAMDYFCFPSRYEGLPGSVIEAQAAGLRCLVSDAVTSEVCVTDLVSMRSIKSQPVDWAEKILDDLCAGGSDEPPGHFTKEREDNSECILGSLRNAGFDVKSQAREMTLFYQRGYFDE